MYIEELDIEITCKKRKDTFREIYNEVRIINKRERERERDRERERKRERERQIDSRQRDRQKETE